MNLLETTYQILLNYNAVDAYTHNYLNATPNFRNSHDISGFNPLSRAFAWYRAPEGGHFWMMLAEKLNEFENPCTPRPLYEYCINRHNQKDEYVYW